MEQYQWGVKITVEYLDGVTVKHTEADLRECVSEQQARTRYEAATDTIAWRLAHPQDGPKYQRISAVELFRRPVGEWETVA